MLRLTALSAIVNDLSFEIGRKKVLVPLVVYWLWDLCGGSEKNGEKFC